MKLEIVLVEFFAYVCALELVSDHKRRAVDRKR